MSVDLSSVTARYLGAETVWFGDAPGMVAELTARVRASKTRAICSSVMDLANSEKPPEGGRRDIALVYDGPPALVIEDFGGQNV